jgi:small-conductance mechanosensitive channel
MDPLLNASSSFSATGISQVYSFLFESVLTQVIFAVAIFFAGFAIAKVLGNAVFRFLEEIQVNDLFERVLNKSMKIDLFVSSLVTWVVYLITVYFALRQVGVASFLINTVFLFVLVLLGVLFILSVKDMIPNFFAGMFIHMQQYMVVGDKIKIELVEGTVENLDLLETHIKTTKGDMIHIPNSYILKHKLRVVQNNAKKKV